MDDTTAVIQTINRMGWLTDRRRWDDLVDVFADEVRLDYTALNGGEPATVPAADMVAGWAAGLGGLQATQHLLGSHLVDVDGDRATATAQFQATHVLPTRPRSAAVDLGGRYHCELTRRDDRWRITAVTMTPSWAEGNQQVMTLAAQRTRSAADAARAFLTGLEALDIDGALANFHDDAVQEMPFAPPGFPDRLDGIAALRRQYGGLPDAYTSMRFPIGRVIDDGDTAVVEYRGEIELRGSGRYDNDYIGVFEARDGRIARFVERFDPTVLSAAFGDAVGETFSLEDEGRQDAEFRRRVRGRRRR